MAKVYSENAFSAWPLHHPCAQRVRVHAQARRLVASAAVSSTRRFDGDAVMSELITSSSCARARQANWLLDMSAMLLWSRS